MQGGESDAVFVSPSPPVAAPSAPAQPVARMSVPDADADEGFVPYDFLPTDPWHERTARPGEAGPSGNT